MRKSPILAQLPFSQPDVILNELKDHATELGLGRATSAGGMAVLEALIAAVEASTSSAPTRTSSSDYSPDV